MVAPPSLKKLMKLLNEVVRWGQMHNTVSQAIKIDQANSSMCFIRQARGVKALSPK